MGTIKLTPEQTNNKSAQALLRITEIAIENDSGQAARIRPFLLHLFNSEANSFNLLDILRGCDTDIAEDCMTVMRLRMTDNREPQHYFIDGTEIFRQMWKDREEYEASMKRK